MASVVMTFTAATLNHIVAMILFLAAASAMVSIKTCVTSVTMTDVASATATVVDLVTPMDAVMLTTKFLFLASARIVFLLRVAFAAMSPLLHKVYHMFSFNYLKVARATVLVSMATL